MGFDPLSLIGDLGGGVISSIGSFISNAQQAAQANKTMDWQQMMSSTAHQREVTDMKSAGLNPILSATGGRGAPMGSVGMTKPQNPLAGVGEGVASAGSFARSESRRLDNETAVAASQIDKNTADAAASNARAASDTAHLGLIDPQVEYWKSVAENFRAKTGSVPSEIASNVSRAALDAANTKVAGASAKQLGAQTALTKVQEEAARAGIPGIEASRKEAEARTKQIELGYPIKKAEGEVGESASAIMRGKLPPVWLEEAMKRAKGPPSIYNMLGDYLYDRSQRAVVKPAGDAFGHGSGTVHGGIHSAKQLNSR
ncbi:MAG: DNA pilot protein [Microvirus sp.]|nr:MAG: DNA pilot protein [Microvirus sp.]